MRSSSDRFFAQDITSPVVLVNGQIEVPRGPGIGVEPDVDLLAELAIGTERLAPQR